MIGRVPFQFYGKEISVHFIARRNLISPLPASEYICASGAGRAKLNQHKQVMQAAWQYSVFKGCVYPTYLTEPSPGWAQFVHDHTRESSASDTAGHH